jgi:hypothetical protein
MGGEGVDSGDFCALARKEVINPIAKSVMKCTEFDLQCAVADWLDFQESLGKLTWQHSPNEGKRKPVYVKMLIKAGMKTGEPDCAIYLKGGVTFFIELKRKGNYLTETQKHRHRLLNSMGYKTFTVTAETPRQAVDEVIRILGEMGA